MLRLSLLLAAALPAAAAEKLPDLWLAHENGPSYAALTPDGRRVATASGWNGDIRLWDPVTGGERLRVQGPKQLAWLGFSPDGKTLAYAGEGKVSFADADTGALLRQAPYEGFLLAVRSDLAVAAVKAASQGIALLDLKTGKELHRVRTPGDAEAAVLSPDGSRLYAVWWKYEDAQNQPYFLSAWDAASGKESWTAPAVANWAKNLEVSPDGKLLLNSGENQPAALYDPETGRELFRTQGTVASACLARGGMAALGKDKAYWQYFGPGGGMFHEEKRGVGGACLRNSAGRLVGGWGKGIVVMPEWNDAKSEPRAYGQLGSPMVAAASPDGKLLAMSDETAVILFDPAKRRIVRRLETPGAEKFLKGLEFSPDGRLLVAVPLTGPAVVSDWAAGKTAATFAGASGVSFSADGKLMAVAGDKTLLYNGFTFAPIRTVETYSNQALMRPDGRHFFKASVLSHPVLYNARSGVSVRDYAPQDHWSAAIAVHPEGKLLASLNEGGQIMLWDIDTGKKVRELAETLKGAKLLKFSRDGRLLAAAGGDDNLLRLWRGPDWAAAGKWESRYTNDLALAPDGRWVAVAEIGGGKWLTLAPAAAAAPVPAPPIPAKAAKP